MTRNEIDNLAISSIDVAAAYMRLLHTELADMFPPMTLEDLEGVNPAYSMQALRTVQRYNREQYNAHEELWDTIAEYVIKERSIRRYTEEVLQSLKNNL